MFRYPGSKWNESAHIVKWVPDDVTTYVEPFLGSGGVWRRLMGRSAWHGLIGQGKPFESVVLNDSDSSVTDFWHSVKGGSFFPQLLECRERLCPELFHENEIRAEFEDCKDRWVLNGEPFAWFYLRLYALGQFVFDPSERANVASFDPMYLGSGIQKQKPEKWELIRSWLDGANVTKQCALGLIAELVATAGTETTVYIDPPYPVAKSTYKMYPQEMTFDDHRKMADLLMRAHFRWLLSLPFSELVHSMYVENTGFRTVLIPSKQSGHLGRCKHNDREYEWLIMP